MRSSRGRLARDQAVASPCGAGRLHRTALLDRVTKRVPGREAAAEIDDGVPPLGDADAFGALVTRQAPTLLRRVARALGDDGRRQSL